jgi:hypothetical protein
MLNIFADALLIAARLGRLPADDARSTGTRLGQDRFHDDKNFFVVDAQRLPGR